MRAGAPRVSIQSAIKGGGADVLQSQEPVVQPASRCPLDSGIRRGGNCLFLGGDCLGTGLSQPKISRHGHIVITSGNVTRLAVLGSTIRVA